MPQPIMSGISLALMRRPPLIMATKTWKILHSAARSALDIRAFHGIIRSARHAASSELPRVNRRIIAACHSDASSSLGGASAQPGRQAPAVSANGRAGGRPRVPGPLPAGGGTP